MSEKKTAVILAGGLGTRLRPYTITMPKPLVPIGDRAILEIIVIQLAKNGFERVVLTVNHQAEMIREYFGDGSKWGITVEYSLEDKPLGTMGPLKLLKDLPENFLIMNGDVLSDIDYAAFFDKHVKSGRMFTISSFKRVNKIDYGVLHTDQGRLVGFEEKPEMEYSVSMGIYAASKEVLECIPDNQFYGLDSLLIENLKEKDIGTIEHDGYWMDIGRPEDYLQACDDVENGVIKI